MYQLSEYNIFQTSLDLRLFFQWTFFGLSLLLLSRLTSQEEMWAFCHYSIRSYSSKTKVSVKFFVQKFEFSYRNMTSCTASLCILCACFLHYNCIWYLSKSVYLILISLQSFYIQSLYILREKHNKFGDAASLSYVVVVLHWISFRKEASRHYSVLNPCVLLYSSSISFDYSGQH